ncbi:unnamed protein product [Trichogramma brassicae]|uniref:Chitin-binding type-4 domain-containing protein n=1 Tax=Trichogramma brassicae TaxID=86971 RepID=A0A6H5IKV8_9HYME|nr:unnamed protein product [Trichogramma brassicae]
MRATQKIARDVMYRVRAHVYSTNSLVFENARVLSSAGGRRQTRKLIKSPMWMSNFVHFVVVLAAMERAMLMIQRYADVLVLAGLISRYQELGWSARLQRRLANGRRRDRCRLRLSNIYQLYRRPYTQYTMPRVWLSAFRMPGRRCPMIFIISTFPVEELPTITALHETEDWKSRQCIVHYDGKVTSTASTIFYSYCELNLILWPFETNICVLNLGSWSHNGDEIDVKFKNKGYDKQYGYNRGQCGVCGDDFSLPRPRPNENGGKYGRGVIVRRYQAGAPIQLQVEITANHKGYFEFSLCPLNSPQDLETEECFNAHPIYLKNGKRQFPVSENLHGIVNISGYLPPNVRCKRCVLRWHYHCGNNIPLNGNQETFRTCSDITIE